MLNKYKWKNRLIYIETPNYQNENYKKTKEIYEKNIKEFHKRYVKLVTNRKKENNFLIKLIGFDGEVKKIYKKLNPSYVFKVIDKMPLAKLMDENKKIKPKNLSLFSDYNKETTVPGLGFKNKEKAIYTIEKIKNKPIRYQVSLVATMIGRAKNHPHKTKDMEEAQKIFEKWMESYKKNKKNEI